MFNLHNPRKTDYRIFILRAIAFWLFGVGAIWTIFVFLSPLGITDATLRGLGLGGILAGICLLIVRCRGELFSSLGFLHLAMLAVFHGGIEFLQVFFPEGLEYRYRPGSLDRDISEGIMLIGISLLIFAVGYFVGYKRTNPSQSGSTSWLAKIPTGFLTSWFVIALLYRIGVGRVGLPTNYWIHSLLSSVFSVLATLLIIKLFYLAYHKKLSPIMLGAYLALIVISGVILGNSRMDILVILLATGILTEKWRLFRWNPRRILTATVVILSLFIFLSIFRDHSGRNTIEAAGTLERLNLVSQTTESLFSSDSDRRVSDRARRDAGYRVDGNSFMGAAVAHHNRYSSRAYFEVYKTPMVMIIPSAVWPGKLAMGHEMRNVTHFFIVRMDLIPMDYIITTPAVAYASGGTLWLFIFMLGYGFILARIEFTLSNGKLWSSILIVALAVAAAWTGRAIDIWPLTIRDGLVVASGIYFWLFLSKLFTPKTRLK